MILLIGANGSMGKRYQAILRHLKKKFVAVDKEFTDYRLAETFSGFIVATTTDTHIATLEKLVRFKKPILCEKPICTSPFYTDDILKVCSQEGTPIRMMRQYAMLDDPKSEGYSLYDFYNTGRDGLYWDCIQIIGLARGEVRVSNDSPIWTCQLNGKKLSLSDMDKAYIDYMRLWFAKPDDDYSLISDMHLKVYAYKKSAEKVA